MRLTREQLENIIDEEYRRVRARLNEAGDDPWDAPGPPRGRGSPPSDPGARREGMSSAQFVDIFIGQLELLAEEMAMELAGHHGNDMVVKLQANLERTLQAAVDEALNDFQVETGLDVWPE